MTRLRIRGPNGMSTVTLGDDATVADLRTLIQEKTALRNFDVKYAYPPKPLLLPDSSAPLSSLGVSLNGEQLIISSQEPREQTPPKASPVSSMQSHDRGFQTADRPEGTIRFFSKVFSKGPRNEGEHKWWTDSPEAQRDGRRCTRAAHALARLYPW